MVQLEAMEYGSRKVSPDVLKPRYIHIYTYIYVRIYIRMYIKCSGSEAPHNVEDNNDLNSTTDPHMPSQRGTHLLHRASKNWVGFTDRLDAMTRKHRAPNGNRFPGKLHSITQYRCLSAEPQDLISKHYTWRHTNNIVKERTSVCRGERNRPETA
jgi:hypothetical protein